MPLLTTTATAASKLRACAFWNDEAGATAWQNAQTARTDHDRQELEATAARLWAQAKRLHEQANAFAVLEAA